MRPILRKPRAWSYWTATEKADTLVPVASAFPCFCLCSLHRFPCSADSMIMYKFNSYHITPPLRTPWWLPTLLRVEMKSLRGPVRPK